ncbi:MAG: VWA domain-containing protein [Leptospiraceae bacterium]|nr:VWA domain-containing protein [Leptospiraceae bacterium]
MKINNRLLKISVIFYICGILVFIPILSDSQGILLDGDKDGVSDALEKYAGLNPNKDECEPSGCSGFYGDEFLVIVLDQSGSMSEKLGADTRMEVAKRVSLKLIEKFPTTAAGLGFYSYGTSQPELDADSAESNGCKSFVEWQSPFQKLNRVELKEHVSKMQPELGTPIAYSLQKFRESILDKKGKFNLLLITDGGESCNGDPVEEAKKLVMLNNKTLMIKLSVIGFGVDAKTEMELKKIAEASNGTYQTVTSEEALEDIFQKPIKDIIASFQGILCLHKQVDKLLLCEQSRGNKIRAAFNKLKSSMSTPFTPEEKETLIEYYPQSEKFIEDRIQSYTKIKKEGTESYIKKIDELSKLLVSPADRIKKKK